LASVEYRANLLCQAKAHLESYHTFFLESQSQLETVRTTISMIIKQDPDFVDEEEKQKQEKEERNEASEEEQKSHNEVGGLKGEGAFLWFQICIPTSTIIYFNSLSIRQFILTHLFFL
jgi:hypothetical protein